MPNSKIINNSISPNGIQKDDDGYTVFYPMGTNKVEIPKNSPHWPKGNKLVSSFVYDKNNKLVGFCDTKAMTTSTNNGEIIVMPYEHIEADFDSIEKSGVQIHAPKATIKKASWNGSVEKEDIPDVDYKYKGCKDVNEIKAKDENYLENDIIDGKWTELLSDLDNGYQMFLENENIISFTSDLSSLNYGYQMFNGCSKLTLFESDLSSLDYGYQMFMDCTSLITFKSINLSLLEEGFSMFIRCSNLTSFSGDLKSLSNGQSMFRGSSNLTTFDTTDLSSLTNGSFMFDGCSKLSSFNLKNLNSLTNGQSMFRGCSNLTSFDSDLKNLTDGTNMFNSCSNLKTFKCNLSSLDEGGAMFNDCGNLTSFTSDLKSLTYANWMFQRCYNLTSFTSKLESLAEAQYMFSGCKLDAPSVKNIIDTINTVTESPILTLGMGCNNNTTDKDIFAQEVGYSDMTTLLLNLQNKGWTVGAQFNGRPSSNYSLRQLESLPVYVKLVEVVLPANEEEFSPIYEYTSSDDAKFYNLDWFHETTGSTEGYTQFNSLEEAITHFKLLNKA